MFTDIVKYTINKNASLTEALIKLNETSDFLVLFIIDENDKLVGTLTDGDIRRAIISGVEIGAPLEKFYFKNFKYLIHGNFSQNEINLAKETDIKILPIVDSNFKILRLINFRKIKTILPIDAVIMAGGEGKRLMPLTAKTPKSLLKVGNKPIIEYNIDRLNLFGIQNQFISINYLGEQIKDFCLKKKGDINFKFLEEKKILGTIGSVRLANKFENDNILVINADLLTNIDFSDMFKSFIDSNADLIVSSIPYNVDLPYAIFETEDLRIKSLKEKPSYVYYANAGIYLFKKHVLELIPKNEFFNATDLLQVVIEKGLKLEHYTIRTYWHDIGNPKDFEKAQLDVGHIKFD